MRIGKKFHTAGDTTRYWVDYFNWLEDGRTINPETGFSAVLQAGSTVTDVTINQVTVTADKLYFFVEGGSVNETFTVQVQVTDTLGEVVIDTINFTVTPP